jgi:hypothetical protein
MSLQFQAQIEAASPEEIQALNDLYDSTNGNYWKNKYRWKIGDPCTEYWFGIGCNNFGQVDMIIQINNNLTGTIPSSIGNLVNLETL